MGDQLLGKVNVAVNFFDTHHRNLGALDAADPYDVCIIGSGFAGTSLGTELANAGLRTVVLESGYAMGAWLFDRRVKRLAEYEVSGDAEYPTERTKARLVGGNSNFWTGRSERLHPSDFEANPYTPRDNPWPISYRDLVSYYDRAEKVLRVRGGQLSEYFPPRSGPLPLAESTDFSALRRLLDRIGVTADVAPTATPRNSTRFFRLPAELLPHLLSSANATLVSGVTVTRLIIDSERRVVGAEAKTLDRETKIVRAKCFVVACGGIESPRLMLLSRSEWFANGIGNDYDLVGRYFTEHPSSNFYAELRHSVDTLIPRHKVGRIAQFYETLRRRGLGSIHISVIQSWLFPHHLLPPIELLRECVRVLGRLRRPTLYFGPNIEQKPVASNRVMLSERRRDRFGNPVAHLHLSYSEEDRRTFDEAQAIVTDMFRKLGATNVRRGPITFARHHMGACRMGSNPRTSVVTADLRVHGVPNLYMLGCESFVTTGSVGPTLTIVALAYRLSEHLTKAVRDLELNPRARIEA
jgi:choline dehydrogenase-like flavoprotein